ncbi:MAG: phospholipase A [Betaproteobacteria bacterium]|nr:phospholipase A [Betaproteobacteria bacterium]
MARWLVLAGMLAALPAAAADWILSSHEPQAKAGARFEVELFSVAGEPLPDMIGLRVRGDRMGRVIAARAGAPATGSRRTYAARMPETLAGALGLELVDRDSNVLVLLVQTSPDALQRLAIGRAGGPPPPISENESVYFVVGTRSGTTGRLQLSFKYRLFDRELGWGSDQPWLADFYMGYTQNAIWNLSQASRPFRDTSFRPSLFWLWQRSDDKTWIDGLRTGYEHESNGKDGPASRSIDVVFMQPEWQHEFAGGARLEFTPKFYSYLDKEDNPDIHRYRGYVDWRVRYGDRERVWSALARTGTAGKGSLQVDFSQRTRVLAFGQLSGYLQVQFFTGYGEDILDYNVHRKSQLRLGFAIVP